MERTPSRPLAVVAVALIAFGVGCGKKSTKPPINPPISLEDADDLVQQVAMMTASDNGGWLVDIQSTIVSIPTPSPIAPSSAARLRNLLAVPASLNRGGFPILWDTSFTIAGMS